MKLRLTKSSNGVTQHYGKDFLGPGSFRGIRLWSCQWLVKQTEPVCPFSRVPDALITWPRGMSNVNELLNQKMGPVS